MKELFSDLQITIDLKLEFETLLDNLQESIIIIKENSVHYVNHTFLG